MNRLKINITSIRKKLRYDLKQQCYEYKIAIYDNQLLSFRYYKQLSELVIIFNDSTKDDNDITTKYVKFKCVEDLASFILEYVKTKFSHRFVYVRREYDYMRATL